MGSLEQCINELHCDRKWEIWSEGYEIQMWLPKGVLSLCSQRVPVTSWNKWSCSELEKLESPWQWEKALCDCAENRDGWDEKQQKAKKQTCRGGSLCFAHWILWTLNHPCVAFLSPCACMFMNTGCQLLWNLLQLGTAFASECKRKESVPDHIRDTVGNVSC